jgi:hypothetical protein
VGGDSAWCSRVHARPAPPAPPKVLVKEEFQGYGITPKDAETRALEVACDWLATHADLGWTPTPEFLREKGMVSPVGEPTEKEFEFAKGITKDGKMQVVTVRLEISAAQAHDIQKQAQQQRMKDRQKSALLVLLAVVCLLGVMGGYLRLEEATKGYYTRLLRIAAIGILLFIVAGLCVVG